MLNEVLGSNNQGGLSAMVAKLEQSGFGDQVKSWLGNDQNLPISADQLRMVLGNDTVRQLAARYNIPVDQLGGTAQGCGSREPRRPFVPHCLKAPFRRYHSPVGSLPIILKTLLNWLSCQACILLAKTARRCYRAARVSSQPSQWDPGHGRRCLSDGDGR